MSQCEAQFVCDMIRQGECFPTREKNDGASCQHMAQYIGGRTCRSMVEVQAQSGTSRQRDNQLRTNITRNSNNIINSQNAFNRPNNAATSSQAQSRR